MREAWHCAEFAQDRSVFIIKSPLDPFTVQNWNDGLTRGQRVGGAVRTARRAGELTMQRRPAMGVSGGLGEAACPQTLKEQEREAERVVNENLNLKMRVKLLEDMLGERSDVEQSMNIWDMRSALSRERERIVEEAAREVSERDELLARSRQTLEGLRAENARLLSQIDGLARERDDDARALATTRRAEEELARQLEAKDVDVMRLSEELRDVAAGLEKAKAQILKRRIYSDPIQQT
jgi:hypothetical protein